MSKWIETSSKQKPKDRQYVLVYPPFVSCAFPDEPRHVLFWHKGHDTFQYYMGDSVHSVYGSSQPTHWMLLPKVYYEENK